MTGVSKSLEYNEQLNKNPTSQDSKHETNASNFAVATIFQRSEHADPHYNVKDRLLQLTFDVFLNFYLIVLK